MFPFSFFHSRLVAMLLLTLLSLPFSLPVAAAETQNAVVVEPAPSVTVPEPVTIRAEPQPMAPPPVEKRSSAVRVSVLSACSMLLDKEGRLDQAAVVGMLENFTPFSVSPLSRDTGRLWIHLDLADVKDPAPHTLWLDLGSQIPSGVSVWLTADGRNWQSLRAEAPGVYDLLSAGRQGQVLMRMDGLPGLWFRPALCSPHGVLTSPGGPGHLLSLAALAFFGTLCLLFSITERGEGRFWIGILAFAAMAQMFWSVPSTPSGSMSTGSFPGIFAAGVALFMLPHAGRVLMRTRESSPFVDTLFLLFALPGACAAIVPLLPGMAWTARLLPLWPLAAFLCFFPSLSLLFRGVQGSGPFTLACLTMGGGAVVSLWGMLHGLESPWWGLAVQAGQAAGLLFLSSAAPHKVAAPVQELALDMTPRRAGEARANTYKENSLTALRRAFRGTVEELFDEACRLDLALSRAGLDKDKVDIMSHADAMVAAARRLSESALDLPAGATLPEASLKVFELRQVIQNAFASVFDEAERKGLGLAWYVAPQLGQKFRGDASRLTALLTLLLADAVRASSHGAVSLHVRRSPDSTHPGHLQFTIADNGEALPPRGRQSMLLSRAWELASAHGGDLFIDSTPLGMELSFSMECAAMEADGVTERSMPLSENDEAEASMPLVILASPDGLSRQMYAHYLDDMGLRLWEARDAEDAAALYASSPAALVIFDGSLGEEDMVQGLASIRMFEGEQALSAVPFLLLARDDMQAERMAKAGCDEALLLPVVRKDLRAMVRWLMDPTQVRPVLSAQRVTLAAVLAGAHSGRAGMQPKSVKAVRRNVEQIAPVPPAGEVETDTVSDIESRKSEVPEAALSLEKDTGGRSERKGWLSSLFRGGERIGTPLEVVTGENASAIVSAETKTRESADEAISAPAEDGDVVELLTDEVLVEESGVQELTEADRVLPAEEQGNAGDELIELGPDFIHAQDMEPSFGTEEAADEDEPLDTPQEKINEGLNRIADALIHGDVQAIRNDSRELSAIADKYGMHTLADMARCFRAAWEEGDVEAAAQIVEEMRSEASRL